MNHPIHHPIHHPKEPGGWGEPIDADKQREHERDRNRDDRSRSEERDARLADPAETRHRR